MAYLNESLTVLKDFSTGKGTDVATAGTLADLANVGFSYFRLTAATTLNSLVAPTILDASGVVVSKELVLTNANSVDLAIVNNSGGTAGNRIFTGTGGDITVSTGATILLKYDATAAAWRLVGGVAGGFAVTTTKTILAAGTIALGTSFFQTIPVVGNAAAVTASTTPFGGTPPLNGTTILLVGTDNTNTVTIPYNNASNGALVNGECVLGNGSSLLLQYITAFARYVEVSRNQILGV